MNESLVQWVLLKRPEYLQKKLGFQLERKLGENYTTEQGRIDFAFETKKEILVVELETGINNKAKLEYCTDQVERYQDIKFITDKQLKFIILYDKENTPPTYVKLLEDFSQKMGIILRTYSILDVQELYKKCLEELSKTTGIYLGPTVAMDVTHLRWLNRIIKPFYDDQEDALPYDKLRGLFKSSTNFGVYTSFAKYFELIREKENGVIGLTDYGKRFRDNYNAQIITSKAMPNLSTEQKRVLLEVLTNGVFTKSKVNVYYFLRFVHLTSGDWLPKSGTPEDKEKLEFVNFLFGKSYRWNTAIELLQFTCNQCEELELVERMKLQKTKFDRVVLTTLGSRVLGYLELYLHLRREQLQIPLQI
ncbi:MAG: hypothetical protein MUP17_07765 [candidate division Zixibacteria bacterium]|nr:hypothetical protein [candidate division Zixibacteria bacterium]